MSDINSVNLSGRLVRDPELRHTKSDMPVANTALAVEKFVKDGDNDVSFVDIVIFGGNAERVASKARKGDSVSVSGRINQSKWETAEGEKRSKLEVVANEVVGEFQFRKADGSDTPEASGEATQAAAAPATDAADDDIPF